VKFSFKTFAAAALLALPTAAQAQIDANVPLNVVSHLFKTPGTGYLGNGTAGGFLADFQIEAVTFDDFLVWCIDPNRVISVPGGPYAYSAFDAYDFAANTAFGAANGYDLKVSDMKKIVGLVGDLKTNWSSLGTQQRADRQGSIWALFRGETPVMANLVDGNESGWLVLYNGRQQTFITYVPEPADVALMLTAVASMAMFLIMRRRRA
jgi:hypothetical protein